MIIFNKILLALNKAMYLIEFIIFNQKLLTMYNSLEILEKNGTILDIGANKGQSVKFFLKNFSKANIISFEPSLSSYKQLIRIKNPRVKFINIGLSHKIGEITFNESIISERSTFSVPYKYTGFKKLLTFNRNLYTQVKGKTETVDYVSLKYNLHNIVLCKIDTEGFEYEVLQGAKNSLINKKVKVIQLEISGDNSQNHYNNKIFKYLKKLDYNYYGHLKHPTGNYYDYFYTS